MDVSSLPFNDWLGVKVVDGNVCLTPTAHHLNHLQTIHASVLFAVAEASAGHLLSCKFPELEHTCSVVLRGSKTKYRKPAFDNATIVATPSIGADAASAFRSKLDQRDRAVIEIDASVSQNRIEVFCGSFSWFVSRRET